MALVTRCCAKCKTPYYCGNPECRCHPRTDDNEETNNG